MQWNAEQYEQFKREREAPFADLTALIHRRPQMRVIDLGCGTGELTVKLAALLPDSDVTGLDSSAEMLKKAPPGARFVEATIEQFAEGGGAEYDLIFSHAALHWLPDHRALIPRLLARVKPGGQLAVQMPSNHEHRAHQLIAEVAGWRRESPLLTLHEYAELLWAHGGRELTVLDKIYCHELAGAGALVEWMRGTTLLPYVERLPEAAREPLIAAVRERFRREFPSSPLLFAFQRTLFSATRV
jgi:trans-aconitate 2-methyltransferase